MRMHTIKKKAIHIFIYSCTKNCIGLSTCYDIYFPSKTNYRNYLNYDRSPVNYYNRIGTTRLITIYKYYNYWRIRASVVADFPSELFWRNTAGESVGIRSTRTRKMTITHPTIATASCPSVVVVRDVIYQPSEICYEHVCFCFGFVNTRPCMCNVRVTYAKIYRHISPVYLDYNNIILYAETRWNDKFKILQYIFFNNFETNFFYSHYIY